MMKWQHLLVSTGGILSILIVAWLVWDGIGYSGATHVLSAEPKYGAMEDDRTGQQAADADKHFVDRARALEAGFKAAFPFR